MSVSIQSPPASQIFSSLESLSPPPTPIAKRGRHFFPRNAATPPTTPMFFPTSHSILRPLEVNSDAIEKRQLALLASRPPPSLRLIPRSRATAGDTKMQDLISQVPPPPFSFDGTSSFRPLPSLSNCSEKSSSDPTTKSEMAPKKLERKAVTGQQPKISFQKLPSIQRAGMDKRIVRRRSSLVARSA